MSRRAGNGALGSGDAHPVSRFCCSRGTSTRPVTLGKMADIVRLDENPQECPPEEIPDIKVFMTIVGGQMAWE